MFYTLYSRHVFRMTPAGIQRQLLHHCHGSKRPGLYNVAQTLDGIIRRDIPMLAPFSVMIVATMTMLVTLLIYMVAKGFLTGFLLRRR